MRFIDWLWQPIQNQYADFEGRTTRQAFWMFVLVYLVILIPLSVIGKILEISFIIQLLSLALLAPVLSIGARRLHDTGLSGWLQLINLIPFIGWIIMIVLFARKGNLAENEFGPVPVAPTAGTSATSATSPTQPASTEPPVTPAE
jgi:uncharacterized membrane protein YhaH (DUF805 family)